VSEILPWMQSHIVELQTSGLVVTAIILLLALIMLNRAASELYKSRSQRVKSEQTFERIQTLLAARDRGESPLEGIRGGRITMSGPVVRSSRPISAKTEPKPAPRSEPKVTPFVTRGSSRSRFVS
jgi:biopolymer transport protein ExbB/TolQ